MTTERAAPTPGVPSGGKMTPEQAIEILVEAGFSQGEAEQKVEEALNVTGHRQGLPDPEALSRIVDDLVAQAPDDPLEAHHRGEMSRSQDRAQYEQLLQEQAGVAMAGGDPFSDLSDEERAAVEEQGGVDSAIEDLQQVLANLPGNEISYDWVYNTLQMDVGALDSDKALLSLATSLEEVAGADFSGAESDEDKVQLVKELLARSPQNTLVQAAVVDWGRQNDVYLSPDEEEFVTLIEQGFSSGRSKTFQGLGRMFDVSPVELARIWKGTAADGDRFEGTDAWGGDVRHRVGIAQAAKSFKEGLELYDESRLLAMTHVNDPELALKLKNDPYSLDAGELRRVLDFAGGDAAPEGDPQVNWVRTRLAGGYQASAAVDTESIRQSVQTLADAWNLTGAENVAAALSSELIVDAIAQERASLPNPFAPIDDGVNVQDRIQDVAAHIRARMRQSPEYAGLFGQKSAGESEEEYVRRFENRSQSVLGDDDIDAVRAGMRSGNVNTVYQTALHSEAGEDSTRFNEIIARNAEIFRQML